MKTEWAFSWIGCRRSCGFGCGFDGCPAVAKTLRNYSLANSGADWTRSHPQVKKFVLR